MQSSCKLYVLDKEKSQMLIILPSILFCLGFAFCFNSWASPGKSVTLRPPHPLHRHLLHFFWSDRQFLHAFRWIFKGSEQGKLEVLSLLEHRMWTCARGKMWFGKKCLLSLKQRFSHLSNNSKKKPAETFYSKWNH